ncbi:hypothetical protein DFP72DRAFT_798204 [Ephemerocybe angulata]|uniref:Fungal-type protein kinase domain-containing protein n=1 Tax=Ephemerocybe angulata TaxID=980116 RepID=A0A8H6IJC2_9AGAR|nr:hypothetical protein DFP72DRAFT_798204 [Tulosesus angulatus]
MKSTGWASLRSELISPFGVREPPTDAGYRVIFLCQPNRLFVRVLVITEKRVRLIQYDRAGALYTPLINYHDNPHMLIRFVVGLASRYEDQLGLDTSVQWGTQGGRKTPVIITITDPFTGLPRVYTMLTVRPFINRADLCGRGTRMWDVTDKDGGDLVLKDAWSTGAHGKPEHVYLAKAEGIEGVQRLVDYEDRTGRPNGEIRSFRPASVWRPFTNKSFQRIVTPLYGSPIERFNDEAELLEALHDAIAAHRKLLERGVLHCDISTGNILFGEGKNPSPGLRGILIDLDYATEVDYTRPSINLRSGTRFYQSIILLKGLAGQYKPAHDHLDDLESFYYVLLDLVFGRCDPGKSWVIDWMEDEWDNDVTTTNCLRPPRRTSSEGPSNCETSLRSGVRSARRCWCACTTLLGSLLGRRVQSWGI